MTPTERDRERADKFRDEVERIYDNWCDVDCRASDLFDRIEEAHAAALADVRREAMEECAKIAETHACPEGTSLDALLPDTFMRYRKSVAAAIRALKTKEA